MKSLRLFWIPLFVFFGCTDAPKSQFSSGDHVEIIVNDKEAIIIKAYWNRYTLRYSDNNGKLQYDCVMPFEVRARSSK